METEENTLQEWIASEVAARGWTIRELARQAGLAHTTINDVLAGKQLPGWDFCARVAGPLGATPIEVFIRAGKLKRAEALTALLRLLAEDQMDTARHLAATVQTLNAEDQRYLLRIARALAIHPD
jgi:transcriptional regulator with XRE-family HTH domain